MPLDLQWLGRREIRDTLPKQSPCAETGNPPPQSTNQSLGPPALSGSTGTPAIEPDSVGLP